MFLRVASSSWLLAFRKEKLHFIITVLEAFFPAQSDTYNNWFLSRIQNTYKQNKLTIVMPVLFHPKFTEDSIKNIE